MGVDDPAGAISVHAVSGLWGLLAVGLFAELPARVLNVAGGPERGSAGQFLAQIVGIATLIGFVFPLTYGLNRALNLVCPHRVVAEGERQGGILSFRRQMIGLSRPGTPKPAPNVPR